MRKTQALYRAIGLVLAGIVIALGFTLTNTYSWFTDNRDGHGKVIATSREDIISHMEVYYRGDTPVLKLIKGDGIEYTPVIFFSVEGDAKDYVLHVDSVKLCDEVEVPIIPNINLSQAFGLIIGPKEEIVGNIRVKHLNEFIDETLEIRFSKEYLLKRYFLNMGLNSLDGYHLSHGQQMELMDLVEDTLLYTGRYLEWEPIEWEEYEDWIGEANISSGQARLIDIIASNILEYNKRIYEVFDITMEKFKIAMEKINVLEDERESLLTKISGLEEENAALLTKISGLEGEYASLISYISDLESEIHRLRTEPKGNCGKQKPTKPKDEGDELDPTSEDEREEQELEESEPMDELDPMDEPESIEEPISEPDLLPE